MWVGQSQVRPTGSVPDDGLVSPELVVLEPLHLHVLGQHHGVIDRLDEHPIVLQGDETAFVLPVLARVLDTGSADAPVRRRQRTNEAGWSD
jgi:hypothetical protein